MMLTFKTLPPLSELLYSFKEKSENEKKYLAKARIKSIMIDGKYYIDMKKIDPGGRIIYEKYERKDDDNESNYEHTYEYLDDRLVKSVYIWDSKISGIRETTYKYDNKGLLVSENDHYNITTYYYDQFDRLIDQKIVDKNTGSLLKSISFDYHNNLLVQTTCTNYPQANIINAYNSFGTNIRSKQITVTDYLYDSNQRLKRIGYSKQDYTEFEYNDHNQLIRIIESHADGSIMTRKYYYDLKGYITKREYYNIDSRLFRLDNFIYDDNGLIKRVTNTYKRQTEDSIEAFDYRYELYN